MSREFMSRPSEQLPGTEESEKEEHTAANKEWHGQSTCRRRLQTHPFFVFFQHKASCFLLFVLSLVCLTLQKFVFLLMVGAS